MRDGHEQVSEREAFLFVAGIGAQARDFGGKGVEEPHTENEEPRRAGVQDGGAIGEEIGDGLWLVLSQIAKQTGQIAGDRGDDAHDRTRGVSHVEIQSGIRDD